MPEPGEQREGHGMGDIRPDDAHDGQAWIKDDQRHRAQRARADGGERDKNTQNEADKNRQPGRAVQPYVGKFSADQRDDQILEQQHNGAQDQRHAERE